MTDKDIVSLRDQFRNGMIAGFIIGFASCAVPMTFALVKERERFNALADVTQQIVTKSTEAMQLCVKANDTLLSTRSRNEGEG